MRRWLILLAVSGLTLVDPLPVASPTCAAADPTSPAPPASPPPVVAPDGWSAAVLPGGDALAVGVAVGASAIVAVGRRTCESQGSGPARCWGQAWTSTDGITWEAPDARTSGLDLGHFRPTTSGPEIGVGGVAYGPAGFLAFGRAETGDHGQASAVWRSGDGTSWERLTASGGFPPGTRLGTILGADDGYLLGGVIYGDRAPRAAIWRSSDGRTWTLARGKETFDIGGYIDTMEDPMAGGVNAFALYPGPAGGTGGSLADGAIAVGQGCMPSFDKEPWAWNGACWGQLWRSTEGLTWQKGEMPRPHGAIGSAVAAGERLVVGVPICLDDCASALMVTDDAAGWSVAYGSPVDGNLRALTSNGAGFQALLAVPDGHPEQHGYGLTLWSSRDGTSWALEGPQPRLPVAITWLDHADMAAAGDQLVVTASGSTGSDELVSVALLSHR
jgi:hypothetical protein